MGGCFKRKKGYSLQQHAEDHNQFYKDGDELLKFNLCSSFF